MSDTQERAELNIEAYEVAKHEVVRLVEELDGTNTDIENMKLDMDDLATEQSSTVSGVPTLKRKLLAGNQQYQGFLLQAKQLKRDISVAETAADVAKMRAQLYINITGGHNE